jgi:hypothetical protein
VGPSPVITPSRTIVSAWAAVWRQDGCGTSDVSVDVSADVSKVLAVGAGIVALLNFFFRSSISIPGMNERLTIRNWQFEIFRWLPIGRCDIGHGSGHSGLVAKRPGVMRAIKGNIGAAWAEKWNSFEKIADKQKDSSGT